MSASRTTAQRALRDAFGAFPTGVAIVTTRTTTGVPVGVTVNSFASVSLDPPLIVWALNRASPSLAIFERATHFAVNVLSAEQAHLSRRFGSRAPDKFGGLVLTEGVGGTLLLDGAAAQFECSVAAVHSGGDHMLFVGHVEHFAHDSTRVPLLFHAGRYHAPGAEMD